MPNDEYKFDVETQKKILALLFQDFAYLSTNGTEVIKPNYFDSVYLRNIAKWIINYYNTYNLRPTNSVLFTELDNYAQKVRVTESDREQYEDLINYLSMTTIEDSQYLKDQSLEFARSVAFRDALEESFQLYENDGNYEKAISIMENALSVGSGDNLGLSLTDCVMDLPEMLKDTYDRKNLFTTGIKSWDTALGGGCAKGEVHCIAAPPSKGKSKLLSHLAYQAIYQKRSTVYFTFEWSEQEVLSNIMSCITGMSMQDLIEPGKLEEYRMKASKIKTFAPKLRTKYFSNKTVSINNLRTYLTKLYTVEEFKPGLIIIDYADLMLPAKETRRSADSTYEEMGLIFYDLKKLADTFECPVFTASQLNKAAWNVQDDETISQDMLADSARKAHIAYSITTLNQNDNEKDAKKMRLYTAKSRKGITGETIYINFDKSNNQVRECEKYDPKTVMQEIKNV